MNSLGAPVDALALDYLSFSTFPIVINNVWTWVAVVTAAVSFLGFRAVGPVGLKSGRQEDESDKSSPPMVPASTPAFTEENDNKEAVMEPASTQVPSSTKTPPLTRAAMPAVEADTTTRGKFTVYYEDESEGEAAWEVDCGGVAVVVGRVGLGGDYWCDNWEKVMRMRIEGGMGWYYRYQDLTAIDGNVVRLWDGCRDKSTISLY